MYECLLLPSKQNYPEGLTAVPRIGLSIYTCNWLSRSSRRLIFWIRCQKLYQERVISWKIIQEFQDCWQEIQDVPGNRIERSKLWTANLSLSTLLVCLVYQRYNQSYNSTRKWGTNSLGSHVGSRRKSTLYL